MSGVAEILERLEAASEGSRELDDSVVLAATNGEMMDWWDDDAQQHIIRAEDGSRVNVTPVTTSLDAALALAERVIPQRGPIELVTCGSAQVTIHPCDPCGNLLATAFGSTPALALCIAILRARSTGEGAAR